MENTPAEMTNFSWTPEMKAFRHYEKNKDCYLEQGLRKGFDNMWREVAIKFGADYESLVRIKQKSYERKTERSFR